MTTDKDETQRKTDRLMRVRSILRSALVAVGAIIASVAFVLLISVGYTQDWTGFRDFTDPTEGYHRGKTLWDWLELLIIPAVLAIAAFWLNRSERRNEIKIAEQRAENDRKLAAERGDIDRKLAADRLQEEALQAYLDKMTELLLEKGLRSSATDSEVRAVAQTRTMTVLRRLDSTRKGIVLHFLYESELIRNEPGDRDVNILNLKGADLSGADLRRADLHLANLSGADFHEADLRWADMSESKLLSTNLRKADLYRAKLVSATLPNAALSEANLRRADLISAELMGADLSGANLSHSDVSSADLSDSNLSEANLRSANLSSAKLPKAKLNRGDFRGAKLNKVDLREAYMMDADLGEADLREASVTLEQLALVKSLKGAIMPDGTRHD